ncbi:MAG: SpoIIE family protein phosphatase [Bacteroidia bacterium]|nr:SpoIIE family protein phosphatase [Bacteroidia bacterium]MDW8058038.1 SpoIIE family protein phosphatase [Bacteroidia bacterium]
MSAPVVVAWLPGRWEKLLPILEAGLGEMELRLFTQLQMAHSFIQRAILEGVELFLVIAPLPEGKEFLEEIGQRWPLAYGLALVDDPTLLNGQAPYLIAYVREEFHSLIPYLHELRNRYLERQAREQQQKILAELHRVSLSLTGEVRLERLIHKLLRITLENTGAKAAFLIIPHENHPERFQVVGYAQEGDYEPRPYPPCPVEAEDRIFLPLVLHAARVRENLLITEHSSGSFLHQHPDWDRLEVRSLLCLPLIYQGRLIGILYVHEPDPSLENLPEKMEFLKLFTAPAAVALQNAQLYAEMESRVQERTKEVIRQKEEIERQSLLLRQQNEDILASLRYAERVQRAIFPSWSELQKILPDSFLLYKPREIVGGDFYWFAQRLSKVIVAAGDCTGHGIPGAFMTIIANTLLKQIVELEGVFKPSEILYLLNLRMRAALQHEEEMYQRFREGMELGLIQLDVKRHKLLYAGAERPLFLVRRGKGLEVRGDRITIGAPYENEAPEFTLHSMDLEPGDMLYLFSDGFSDQFSSEGKKYQLRRFYEFLEVIADQPARQQAILLETELQRWMNSARQTDDILVLGIRVT